MPTYQLKEAPAMLTDVGSTETIIYCTKEFFVTLVESQPVKDHFGIYTSSNDIRYSPGQFPDRWQINICGITFVSVF